MSEFALSARSLEIPGSKEAPHEEEPSISELLNSKDEIIYEAPGTGTKDRYEYYIIATKDGKEVFVKETDNPEKKKCLAFEASATIVAKEMGIPCTSVYNDGSEQFSPYVELGEKGAIALEVIDSKDWDFLPTRELLTSINSDQSRKLINASSKILVNYLGSEVPAHINTDSLRQGETATERYKSPESVYKQWETARELIGEKIADVFPVDTNRHSKRISDLVSEGQSRLKYLVDNMGSQDKKYFVHGDFNPSNMCVAKNNNQNADGFLVIDFEQAGVTNYQALAKMNDLSNFFGVLWEEPDLQDSLIRSYFQEETKHGQVDQCYSLMRAAIIFGTTDYARYGMAYDHPEHGMSVALLNNLEKNLGVLNEEYTDKLKNTAQTTSSTANQDKQEAAS